MLLQRRAHRCVEWKTLDRGLLCRSFPGRQVRMAQHTQWQIRPVGLFQGAVQVCGGIGSQYSSPSVGLLVRWTLPWGTKSVRILVASWWDSQSDWAACLQLPNSHKWGLTTMSLERRMPLIYCWPSGARSTRPVPGRYLHPSWTMSHAPLSSVCQRSDWTHKSARTLLSICCFLVGHFCINYTCYYEMIAALTLFFFAGPHRTILQPLMRPPLHSQLTVAFPTRRICHWLTTKWKPKHWVSIRMPMTMSSCSIVKRLADGMMLFLGLLQ